MGIAVLGTVSIDGSPRSLARRDRVVLATLAMQVGRPVTVDQLSDALWGESPPDSAAKVVQGCVLRLRKQLGPEAIVTVPGGYKLALSPEEVDAHRFERHVRRARDLLTLGDPERAGYVLSEAFELWQGRPLGDIEESDVGRVEAERLAELFKDAEELRVEAGLRAGHVDQVLDGAHALVREAPLRERRWALLARAQYQAGRQADALRTLHGARAILVRELGLDPGPELVALEHAILVQDPSLEAEAAPPSAAGSPYRGLAHFDVDDAESFFGREREIDECLARLRRDRVLVVTGPSGCGKSSFVRAGLAAAVRRSGKRVAVMTPGPQPLDALEAVRRPSSPELLVVDQCEEAFTLCEDVAVRRSFLDQLVTQSEDAYLVVAMRADRLGDVAAHARFAGVVEGSLLVLVGMREPEVRRVIEVPARQAGLIVEPGLVDVLVNELADEPGALPLLSHVLRETWLRREGRTLTVDGYRASGGIRGSVAQSAEAVYQAADPEEQDLLRALMLRLVAPGAEGEPVRARVPRRQIAAAGQAELVDRLVESRLITSDADSVEVAHEALVRGWPRLREWLDEDVVGQRIMHHLSDAAEAWLALGRPDSELYRGVRLARALEWRDRSPVALSEVEQEFLDAGRRLSEAELRDARERAVRERHANRRLRSMLAAAVALMTVAVAATVYALDQRDLSLAAAGQARDAATRADAERVGARAQLLTDLDLSLLLAVAGVRLADGPQTRANLSAVADRYGSLLYSSADGGYVDPMEVSPDGRLVASSDDRNRLHLYRAEDGRRLRSFQHEPFPGQQVGVVAEFSPDGAVLAAGTYGATRRPVRLLDPDRMRESGPQPGHTGLGATAVGGLEISADGRLLAATLQPAAGSPASTSYLAVWRLTRPELEPRLFRLSSGGQALSLHPDGRTAYTSWPLTAWDMQTGKPRWRRPDLRSYFAMDLTPSGDVLGLYRHDGVGTPNSTVLLVDARTGTTLRTLRGHDDQPRDLRFSNEGNLLATYAHDGELIVWDVTDGERLHQWRTGEVGWALDFSADDRVLFTGGSDGMLRAWDLAARRTAVRRTASLPGGYVSADLSPTGHRVALRWLDDDDRGWIRFVDPATGEATRQVALPIWPGPWRTGVWSPDGSAYASNAGCDDPPVCTSSSAVVVLDPETGRVVAQRDLPEVPTFADEVWSMGYVADGTTLLYGDAARRTRLLDARTLGDRPPRIGVTSSCCVTPVGDGPTAVLLEDSSDGATQVWRHIDVRTGEVKRSGQLPLRVHDAQSSPVASRVAFVGDSGQVHLVDLRTGRHRQSTGGPGGVLLRVDWSADGTLLVAGGSEGEISLWHGGTLEHLGTVHPPGGSSVAMYPVFIADGHDVRIVSADGDFYRWDTDPGRALASACRMAGRSLSRDEWQEFLPHQPFADVCPRQAGGT